MPGQSERLPESCRPPLQIIKSPYIIWDVSGPIITLWYAGIAAKAFAAYRMVRNDLFQRLPIFWAFIVISVARSIALACLAGDPRQYAELAADTMPMMLLSEGFAITSVYWLLTENFPNWRKPGAISLSVLTILGMSATLLLRNVGVPVDWGYGWADVWQTAILLQRHVMVAMAVVLLGVRLLLAMARMIPVRPTARRAADVLCVDVMLGLTGSVLTMWIGRRFPLIAYAWPVLCGLTSGLLWAFWLPAASDECEYVLPRWARQETFNWRAGFQNLFSRG
jgi:hypothetical protein